MFSRRQFLKGAAAVAPALAAIGLVKAAPSPTYTAIITPGYGRALVGQGTGDLFEWDVRAEIGQFEGVRFIEDRPS